MQRQNRAEEFGKNWVWWWWFKVKIWPNVNSQFRPLCLYVCLEGRKKINICYHLLFSVQFKHRLSVLFDTTGASPSNPYILFLESTSIDCDSWCDADRQTLKYRPFLKWNWSRTFIVMIFQLESSSCSMLWRLSTWLACLLFR